jgi:thiosulfate/3-mercaptopyruvate sulfurtransferase
MAIPDDVREKLEDLPPSSKFIFKTLERHGRATQKTLIEETMLSARTTRYGIEKLEEAGLVESMPALHDARQTCYELTGGGHEYANDVLVEAEWVQDRLDRFRSDDPAFRLVEVDTTGSYEESHIPGAVRLDWQTDLTGENGRGIAPKEQFEELLGERAVTEDSTVVLYGDQSNWFAAYAYWLFKYFGHESVSLLNGGRNYWLDLGYPTTEEVPSFSPQTYEARGPFEHVRARRDDVETALMRDTKLLDVRSAAEFSGDRRSPPDAEDAPETMVGGHVPGSVHLPWSEVVDDDGRFESESELRRLFEDGGIFPNDEVIVYCHLGERSAVVWFVLSELLGYDDVRNYDGSWTEWANLVDAPVETEE